MGTIDDESFMIACLKLAKAYLKIMSEEIRLYSSRPGHKPLETNFSGLVMALEERIITHSAKLEQVKNPEKPKDTLKQHSLPSVPVLQTKEILVQKSRLKKRVV